MKQMLSGKKFDSPVVSIISIAYNQEKFIEQAIEGFLMQKTNFPIEVLIHDDASTDNTAKIIAKYATQYPDVIKPLYEKKNQFLAGNDGFINDMYNQARGKYIAICEGDDFWSDPEKLQRQVDFLESHPQHSMCFHPVRVFFEDGLHEDSVYPEGYKVSDFTLENLLKRNFIQANSIMYRANSEIKLPSGIMPLDWYTHLFYAQYGKIGFINRVMSAYRRHNSGIWWETAHKERDAAWKKYGVGHMLLYAELLKMYGGKIENRQIIDMHIKGTVSVLARIDGSEKTHLMDDFAERSPELSKLALLSLSRITYEDYTQLEKDEETQKKLEERLQETADRIEKLEQEKEDILTSKAYVVGNKLANISRSVRRIK